MLRKASAAAILTAGAVAGALYTGAPASAQAAVMAPAHPRSVPAANTPASVVLYDGGYRRHYRSRPSYRRIGGAQAQSQAQSQSQASGLRRGFRRGLGGAQGQSQAQSQSQAGAGGLGGAQAQSQAQSQSQAGTGGLGGAQAQSQSQSQSQAGG